jgi:glucose-1-phosphate thymidylyltransferase
VTERSLTPRLVGIIPAAGKATRLGTLPCSKEILPVGVGDTTRGQRRIIVLSDFLIAEYRRAGIRRVIIATHPSKADIGAYFGNGEGVGVDIEYVRVESPDTPTTVATALQAAQGEHCAVGFPDVVYGNDDGYSKMLDVFTTSEADVVLGLYPTDHPELVDMVRLDRVGRVEEILIKAPSLPDGFDHCWLTAIWRPSFSDYLSTNLPSLSERAAANGRELYLGDVVTSAIEDGLGVHGVTVSTSPCLDAGTLDTYATALANPAVLSKS